MLNLQTCSPFYPVFQAMFNVLCIGQIRHCKSAHKDNFSLANLSSEFEFTLASAILHRPVGCRIRVYISNFTLAKLGSDFKFTLANEILQSLWRHGDGYVHCVICQSKSFIQDEKNDERNSHFRKGKTTEKRLLIVHISNDRTLLSRRKWHIQKQH